MQLAAMQQRKMPYQYIIANVGVPNAPRHVNHRAVLHIGARPDADFANVTAQHAVIPNARLRPDPHIANNARTGRNKSIGGNAWGDAAKWQDCDSHDFTSMPETAVKRYLNPRRQTMATIC
jgi:hypothetical protein